MMSRVTMQLSKIDKIGYAVYFNELRFPTLVQFQHIFQLLTKPLFKNNWIYSFVILDINSVIFFLLENWRFVLKICFTLKNITITINSKLQCLCFSCYLLLQRDDLKKKVPMQFLTWPLFCSDITIDFFFKFVLKFQLKLREHE